jgi:two-component system LytT family response regulator
MSLRVVLADDEPLARERLRTLLAARPECTLTGECADGAEAVDVISAERPDLVLLDVQMPELDGFEVLDALPPDVQPAVIFVTAYDEYAVRAFAVSAVDYLLKPVEPARFTAAVDRALARREGGQRGIDAAFRALMTEVQALRGHARRFVVRDGHRLLFIPADQVDWIDAAGNYVRLHAGGRSHLLRETMKSVEARLDPERFVRVHRSAIVNLERIASMEPYFHGEYVLTLRDGTRLNSSRSQSARLRALIR